jgi:hypothetical protein
MTVSAKSGIVQTGRVRHEHGMAVEAWLRPDRHDVAGYSVADTARRDLNLPFYLQSPGALLDLLTTR